MNVIELLDNELKNKNWPIEQKARYLYLQSCKLFSYDPRYVFCDLLCHGEELKKEIKNYEFDLEKVKNFEVICTSYIKNIYPRLLKELLGIEDIKKRGVSHRWCEFNDEKRELKADATYNSDLTRVKMGLSTYGYKPLTRDYNFLEELKEIDKNIGYIREEYFNDYLKRKKENIEIEFKQDPYILDTEDSTEFILFKWNTLQEIYHQIEPQLKNVTDHNFCISYLAKKLEIDLEKISLYFIDEQKKWYFYNIYILPLLKMDLYFLLEKDSHGFNYYEIHKEEALKLCKHFNGLNKDYLITR